MCWDQTTECSRLQGHHFLLRIAWSAAAIRTTAGEQAAGSACLRGVVKSQRRCNGVASVQADERTQLPVPHKGIRYRVDLMDELLASSKRQLIRGIAGKDVRLVKEAGTPLRPAIVDVLPPRQPERGLGTVPTPRASAVVTSGIGQAFGVRVCHLPIQTVAHALAQHCLQRIVTLAGIGIGSADVLTLE